MKLLQLRLRNFMPYKGEVVLDFPEDETRNVLVVMGKNMRGKTSILNGIRWAFYGRSLGRHMKELNLFDMINKESLSEGDYTIEARITFQADGSTYVLSRKAIKKLHILTPTKAEDLAVTVSLQKDSSFITADQIDFELSRFIPEQISRFFLFDGELLQEYENLSIEGSEQGRRIKEAIEQILGVPTLLNADGDITTILKVVQKQLNIEQSHSKELEERAKKLDELQSEQDSLEKDIITLKTLMDESQSEVDKLQDELEKVDKVHQAKVRLDLLENKEKEACRNLEEIQQRQTELLGEAWRDLVKVQVDVIKDEAEKEESRILQRAEANLGLRFQMQQLREFIQHDKCSLCGHPINTEGIEAAKARIGQLSAVIQDDSREQEKLDLVRSRLKVIRNIFSKSCRDDLLKLESTSVQLEREIVKYDNDIECERREIEGYDTTEIARKRTVMNSLIKEIGAFEAKIDAQNKRLSDVTKKVALISRQMASNASVRQDRTARLVSICTDIQTAIRNSIEILRDQLRNRVAEKANQAFKQMTTQQQYKRLEINDNYGLAIIDSQDRPVTIRSAGAEQIVALSLIDGLTRTGRAAGPIIMDTPFGRLDTQHRSNILRYLPTTTSQLVLLVHDGELRIDTDLSVIAERVSARYEIIGVNSNVSKLEKM